MRDRGICRQCKTLSSDCFNMIDDGIEFHLARWLPAPKQKLGKQVADVMLLAVMLTRVWVASAALRFDDDNLQKTSDPSICLRSTQIASFGCSRSPKVHLLSSGRLAT
jgi:hypothetical protein